MVCLAVSQDLGDSAVEYDEDEDYNDIQQSENDWGGNTTSRKRFTDSRNAFVLEVTTVLCPLSPLYFVSSYRPFPQAAYTEPFFVGERPGLTVIPCKSLVALSVDLEGLHA